MQLPHSLAYIYTKFHCFYTLSGFIHFPWRCVKEPAESCWSWIFAAWNDCVASKYDKWMSCSSLLITHNQSLITCVCYGVDLQRSIPRLRLLDHVEKWISFVLFVIVSGQIQVNAFSPYVGVLIFFRLFNILPVNLWLYNFINFVWRFLIFN